MYCTEYDVQEAQLCRQDPNNEQELQEAQMYWRHGCTGGTVIQEAHVYRMHRYRGKDAPEAECAAFRMRRRQDVQEDQVDWRQDVQAAHMYRRHR